MGKEEGFMAVKSTFDFDQMLSSAREAYAEELLRMADEGLDFTFTYSDNVAPSSSAGKLVAKYPDRCFNFGIAKSTIFLPSFVTFKKYTSLLFTFP